MNLKLRYKDAILNTVIQKLQENIEKPEEKLLKLSNIKQITDREFKNIVVHMLSSHKGLIELPNTLFQDGRRELIQEFKY